MQRTIATGSSSGNFVDRSDGVSGTKITAADMQAHQDEIINAIIGGGLSPNGAVLTQLRDAIKVMARDQAIPIGFIYTQLPGKSDPATLYPWATWVDKSSEFAGAFFRAAGGKSAAFGGGVQADAMQGHRHNMLHYKGATSTASVPGTGDTALASYQYTSGDPVTDGVNGTPRTADETRPTNYTVKIWERTA